MHRAVCIGGRLSARSRSPKGVCPIAKTERLETRTLCAFGLTASTSSYTVDTGANTVFTISRTNGDLTSVKFNGTELTAPFSLTNRYSHYESGLSSSATTITATTDNAAGTIKIACFDSSLGVTQYYIARKGFNNIYMALYAAALPTPGEMRYITYLNKSVFTNIPDSSNISQTDASVEGSDVYYNTTTGYTYSKFYGTNPAIDDQVHGVTGTGLGAFMDMGQSWQTASGGPFFKDIDFQTTGNATEMYDVMNSGHLQTESFRPGLHGPYALQFTNGSAPVTPDYTFYDGLGLTGYVASTARGTLAGHAGAINPGSRETVALSNGTAQYWANPDASGNFVISGIIPGVYTQTLYQGELAVGSKTVTIFANTTDYSDIVDTYYTPAATFRIGTWDGTPGGFLNADKINTMHPSDTRMAAFVNTNYVVGTSTDAAWPLAQFKQVDNDQKITFTLTAAQAAVAQTFRIGISEAFAGGRPQITVNTGQKYGWTSALPAATTQPDSRGLTRATWRGNNFTFTYSIPTSALKAGSNTIDISTNSGSTGSTVWLSPSITFDALDLVPTASLTNAPRITRVAVTPAMPVLTPGGTETFTATAYDQSNNLTPANCTFSVASGLIDDNGHYTAPGVNGTDTVTANSGTISGTASVTIRATPPSISSFVVNDGSAQRSRITSLTLTFDRAVDLTSGAITLWQRTSAAATAVQVTGFTLTPTSGGSTYTLTSPGAGFSNRSLTDGLYELRIAAASVTSNGTPLAADASYAFHRLFGDIDGNHTVDFSDFLKLQAAFGSTVGSAAFLAGFDSNDNGVIDFSDFLQLQTRFGTSI